MRTLPILALLAGLCGCRQDMHDQPKLQTFEQSSFFSDGRASRPLVEGTVARGRLYFQFVHANPNANAFGAETTARLQIDVQ